MMIFIFIAAILVRNMDGFSSSQSFLNSQRSSVNQTMKDDGEDGDGSYQEISLLISIVAYNTFSASGMIIVPWTLSSELYPIQVRMNMRGKGVNLTSFWIKKTSSSLCHCKVLWTLKLFNLFFLSLVNR